MAKSELFVNVPMQGLDWKSFKIGHVHIISNDKDGLKMRLLLDDEAGHEIGFVSVIADKDLVFGL